LHIFLEKVKLAPVGEGETSIFEAEKVVNVGAIVDCGNVVVILSDSSSISWSRANSLLIASSIPLFAVRCSRFSLI